MLVRNPVYIINLSFILYMQLQRAQDPIAKGQQAGGMQEQRQITFDYFDSQKQAAVQRAFPLQILNFNIELLSNNHDQPYSVPKQIVDSQYPFQIIQQFIQIHQYQSKGFNLIKPINSKDYKDIVDQKTYQVCGSTSLQYKEFVLRQNAQKAAKVANLCRFIRFHQLHDAICAAIATNYYIVPNDQKQVNLFKKTHKIDDLSAQQVCQIIKEYEDIFSMIQTKAKQQFSKQEYEDN